MANPNQEIKYTKVNDLYQSHEVLMLSKETNPVICLFYSI